MRIEAAPPTELTTLADDARRYAAGAAAPNTLRAYRADWRHFVAWCAEHRLEALPAAPEAVALYLVDLARTRRVATLQRRLSSISRAHRLAGAPSPTQAAVVRETWAGIRRAKGVAPTQVAPAATAELRRMVTTLDDSPIGLRDRALLLLGFAGALRRSELVALDAGDVDHVDEGLVVTLRRAKTDQEARGRRVGVPYGSYPATCPVRSLRRWLEAAAVAEGPVFRPVDRHGRIGTARLSDKAVARAVKRAAGRAGLDPTRYAGHSLRAGFATAAAAAGASERAIQNQTGHKSVTVLRGYIREGSLFLDNAAARVGR